MHHSLTSAFLDVIEPVATPDFKKRIRKKSLTVCPVCDILIVMLHMVKPPYPHSTGTTDTHTHTLTHTHTNTHTHAHPHPHTHTHTHSRTDAHKHTHTQIDKSIL